MDCTARKDKTDLEDKTVGEFSWSDASGGAQIYEEDFVQTG